MAGLLKRKLVKPSGRYPGASELNCRILCYLPEPGYRADGNCRACMVEIEGERVLAASCIRKPEPDMKVKSNSARAVSARKTVFDMLASDQPERNVAHDKSSRFWQWAEMLGTTEGKFPRRNSPVARSKSCCHASVSGCLQFTAICAYVLVGRYR